MITDCKIKYLNISVRRNLLKRLLSFLILPLLFIVLSGTAPASDIKAPQIFFKEKTYTADEVLEGTPVEHTFSVFNRGNAVLRIEKVKPG